MHPALLPLLKIGTQGAGIMAGATIATQGIQKLANFADSKLGTGIEPVISGPLDMLGTLLDPLDLTGMRARKEAKRKAAAKRASQKMKQQEKAKKMAEAKASEADKLATEAEKRAADAEAAAKAAEARANDAEARAKREKAVKARRWAGFAKRTASEARAQKESNPDAALEMAKAAFDLAKFAISPPKSAQQALQDPNLDPEGKSMLADVFDEMNRMGPAPNYDALLQRMWGGVVNAGQAMGEAWGGGDDDDGIDGPDDPEVDGPDETAESVVSGVESGEKAETGWGAWADDYEEESAPVVAGSDDPEVAGACCSSCAFGGSCGGKARVPENMIDGSVAGDGWGEGVAGEEDDDEGVGGYFDPDVDDDVFSVAGSLGFGGKAR